MFRDLGLPGYPKGIGGGGSGEFSHGVVELSERSLDVLKSRTLELVPLIKGPIDSGLYDLVVGDDFKGHFPAELLWRVINIRYLQIGLPPINLIHIQGSHGVKVDDMIASLSMQTESLETMGEGKKVLLVTETLGSGSTLKKFRHTFERLGYDFDILSYATSGKETEYRSKGVIPESTNLFSLYQDPRQYDDFIQSVELLSGGLYPHSFQVFREEVVLYATSCLPKLADEIATEVF